MARSAYNMDMVEYYQGGAVNNIDEFYLLMYPQYVCMEI
jgi:hypothetical protein